MALARALNAFHGDPTDHFTVEAYLRDGCGPDPRFLAFVAERDGTIVGYALMVMGGYETAYAAWGAYLEDLFVVESARRSGVGRALVAACAAEVRRRGRSYLWWVSRGFNDAAREFYRRLTSIAEPVVAHALAFEDFERLAAEGDRGEG